MNKAPQIIRNKQRNHDSRKEYISPCIALRAVVLVHSSSVDRWIGCCLRRVGESLLAGLVSILAVGVVILAYNSLFRIILPPAPRSQFRLSTLVWLTWGQITPDLVCLTFLVILTGGLHSPLLGFSVFHMVIASILLPKIMAFTATDTPSTFFWSNGYAWGTIKQRPTRSGTRVELKVLFGQLELKTLELTGKGAIEFSRPRRLTAGRGKDLVCKV